MDPATDLVINASRINDNIFCAGHSLLSSGEVLVTGGTIDIPQGIKAASSYNPLTNTWTRLPDMNAGRFYPTNATLANGDVVVISGNKEDASRNLIPQVWQVGADLGGTLRAHRSIFRSILRRSWRRTVRSS